METIIHVRLERKDPVNDLQRNLQIIRLKGKFLVVSNGVKSICPFIDEGKY